MFATLSCYLRGEKKLWKAFWLLHVLPGCITILLLTTLFYFKLLAIGLLNVALILMTIALSVTNIAIWQCSRNCKRPIWTWIVQLSLIFSLAADLYHGIKNNPAFFQSGSLNLSTITILFDIAFFVFFFIYIVQSYTNKTRTSEHGKKAFLVFMGFSIFFGFLVKPRDFRLQDDQQVAKFWAYDTPINEDTNRTKAIDAFNKALTYSHEKNYAEAAKWYQIAINFGSTYAKNNLAILYDNGKGVPKDMKKAMQLYWEAAHEGDYMAYYNIGLAYELGKNDEQSYKKAFEHYLIAAKHGNACAQNDVGMFYAAGTGVPADAGNATHWLQQAALSGLNNDRFVTKHPLQDQEAEYIKAFVQYQTARAKHEAIPDSLNEKTGLVLAQNLADYFQHDCRD